MTEQEINKITEKIIGCAFEVSHRMRPGYPEKGYRNALQKEILKCGLPVERELATSVIYDGDEVCQVIADIVVAGLVIVEVKATKRILDEDVQQVLRYLDASGLSTGLIINFGTPKAQIRRVRK